MGGERMLHAFSFLRWWGKAGSRKDKSSGAGCVDRNWLAYLPWWWEGVKRSRCWEAVLIEGQNWTIVSITAFKAASVIQTNFWLLYQTELEGWFNYYGFGMAVAATHHHFQGTLKTPPPISLCVLVWILCCGFYAHIEMNDFWWGNKMW